ncbi:hypothetical protein [Streptomyces altiplanensis]
MRNSDGGPRAGLPGRKAIYGDLESVHDIVSTGRSEADNDMPQPSMKSFHPKVSGARPYANALEHAPQRLKDLHHPAVTDLRRARIPAMQYIRPAKAALTVATATAACHSLMSAGYTWAHESRATDGHTMFSGAFEFLLTTAASWALMPLLLWAGMWIMRETGNAVLVLVGGLVWVGVSGYYIDDIDHAGGHIPILVLVAYVLLGTGLAGADSGRR